MNLPVRSGCFIPSRNTVIRRVWLDVFLLSKAHESITVLERGGLARDVIGSPKPANTILHPAIPTYKTMIPLVLVKVCDLVDSAFYHIKKLPRRNAFALRDLRDLEQSLLAKVIEISVIVLLLRRVRHRGDSERKVKRAILVIDEALQSVAPHRLIFWQILVNLVQQSPRSVVVGLLGSVIVTITAEERLHHSPMRTTIVLEILAIDFRVFLFLQLDLSAGKQD